MRTDLPKTIYLKDYAPYPFEVKSLDLNFNLSDEDCVVTSVAAYRRIDSNVKKICLYGEALELLELKLNGVHVHDYTCDEKGLMIPISDKNEFTLEIVTRIYPQKNTRLEGLYKSGGNFCTQCEAEGFRRITYFPDRPDILTTYHVRIEADKEKYPVLLSNGNHIDRGDLDGGRHYRVWQDPYPKPCYLFALVAGDLTYIHDTYTTKSGRHVDLYIYVRKGDEAQCTHAMESLKNSMKWDERVYGLEYDLDLFNIVAVSDFNMGAMENKSLNIFNTALVLAHQETATDQDFMRVESVIAHEYFHNWSGNRVTCRDWFQLSLKEGLTVFRDQEFSADMHSRPVQRIDDVTHLRRFQFSEDASPLAHPIRPDNYIEINNFYTMTVYEKGAEVIRMLRTILGEDNYRKGTDLYFSRHDGQAVTCDDFVQALQEAGGIDLTQFKLWYMQAGTPEVRFNGKYNSDKKNYTITLSQSIPDTPGQKDKAPMVIPVRLGLLGNNGDELCETQTLLLDEFEKTFEVEDISQKPVPSILREFSAPVNLVTDLSGDELSFLMVHDSDGFNRWEAGQIYATRILNNLIDGKEHSEIKNFISAYGKLIDKALDKTDTAFMARALALPDVSTIALQRKIINPEAIYKAREELLKIIFDNYGEAIQDLYDQNRTSGVFSIKPEEIGRRALQNQALGLLFYGESDEIGVRAYSQYEQADNMTDRVAALSVLAKTDWGERTKAFDDFYTRFKNYPLVIDKWFALQACAVRSDFLDLLKSLRNHPDFNIKNPNRVRSLYSAFAMNNPVCFHHKGGAGYDFLRDAIIELNEINPQIGARLLTPLREWRRYTEDRQIKMQETLELILKIENIASDIYEIASKSLNS